MEMSSFSRVVPAILGLALLAAPVGAQTDAQKRPAAPAAAQGQPQMTPEEKAEMEAYAKAGTPGPQHKLLAAMAGEYEIKVKSWHAAGSPPQEDRGTARRTMILEGRVLSEEISSTMMGQPYAGRGLTGYNNVTGKYWSTWNDNMSTGIVVTEGTCDNQMQNCAFTGSWVDPVKKTPIRSRMTTRWTSPTTETFEMYAPGKDGKEMKMMEITYTKR
jgi:hypothetical protein